MTLLDRRVDTIQALNQKIQQAQTFGAWLNAAQEQYVLREAVRLEQAEVGRLARGWTYIPPPTLR